MRFLGAFSRVSVSGYRQDSARCDFYNDGSRFATHHGSPSSWILRSKERVLEKGLLLSGAVTLKGRRPQPRRQSPVVVSRRNVVSFPTPELAP